MKNVSREGASQPSSRSRNVLDEKDTTMKMGLRSRDRVELVRTTIVGTAHPAWELVIDRGIIVAFENVRAGSEPGGAGEAFGSLVTVKANETGIASSGPLSGPNLPSS